MSKKIRASDIKRALAQYHSDPQEWNIFFEVKNGPTWNARRGKLLIMDGLAIKKSWANPRFVGYEIKTSRSDFLNDEKWRGYLEYCHQLYFVCPKKLISRKEIEAMDENVGLMYYNPEYENCGLHTMKAPVIRNIEIDTNMLYYIIMSKLEPDKYPFFSSKKEYFKKWLHEKQSNKNFGLEVQGKIGDVIYEQERTNKELKKKLERFENKEKIIKDVFHYLDIKGLLSGWGTKKLKDDWKEKLNEILGSSFDSHEKYKIEEAIESVEKLKPLINYEEAK